MLNPNPSSTSKMGNKAVEVPSEAIVAVPNQSANGYVANGHASDAESQLLNNATEDAEGKKSRGVRVRKRRRMRLCIVCITVVIVILIGIGVGVACVFRNPRILRYPLHASCNITWTLSGSCNNAKQALLEQIDAWKGNETCGFGQKCLYSLVSSEENLIKATHTTPVRRYIDDMSFTFYSAKRAGAGKTGCNIIGFSTSRTWYAVLDYGTNYCNLHNLVAGTGLPKDKTYSELTRDEICTQYSSSNCDKY